MCICVLIYSSFSFLYLYTYILINYIHIYYVLYNCSNGVRKTFLNPSKQPCGSPMQRHERRHDAPRVLACAAARSSNGAMRYERYERYDRHEYERYDRRGCIIYSYVLNTYIICKIFQPPLVFILYNYVFMYLYIYIYFPHIFIYYILY